MTVDEMEFGLRQIAVRRKNALLFGEEVLLNKVADFIAALPANLAKPVPVSGGVVDRIATIIDARAFDPAARWREGEPREKRQRTARERAREIIAALASSTPAEAADPVAYEHFIAEPDGQKHTMFSRSRDNPWGHWLSGHRETCVYKCTPLYATPPSTAPDAGMVEALADPVVVHVNMLRGVIAKPSINNIAHLYPEVQQMKQALISTLKHFRWPTSAEHETRDKVMAALAPFDDPPLTPAAAMKDRPHDS